MPVTGPGRIIAIGLMVGGVIVRGVTSATIISMLSDQVRRLNLAAEEGRKTRERAGALPPAFPDLRHHRHALDTAPPDDVPAAPQTPPAPPTEGTR